MGQRRVGAVFAAIHAIEGHHQTSAGTSISALEVFVRVTCNVLPDRVNKADALRLPLDPAYVIDKAWLELVHTRATNMAQSAENMDRMPLILPMLKNPTFHPI